MNTAAIPAGGTQMAGPVPLLSHDKQGHIVQFYSDDGFLLDELARFIGDAIAVGDAAVAIATHAHRDALRQRLRARGVNTAEAIRQRRCVLLDASETLSSITVDGKPEKARFVDVIGAVLKEVRQSAPGHSPVAVFGEMVALLWAEGKLQDAIRVEQFWNDLAERHSFSLLCAYPIPGFDSEKDIQPILKICEQHSRVTTSQSYVGLRSVEERLRIIAELQQKAQILEKELASRQKDDQFRLLVEAVKDYAIFMLNADGNIATWNPGAERIKQYRASEIIGKHFSCFYPEEDVQNGKPQWELVIAAQEGQFEDEGWRIRKDGSRFWANVIITAVRDGSGKLVGFAKVTRDVTAKMQAQQALQKEVTERRDAQQQLHESEKSLRELSLHLLRTQDEERRRIGRDLHDSLGQSLVALKMKLSSVARVVGEKGQVGEDISQCTRLTDDSIKEVRTVSYLLYPPMLDEMGLKSAIPWYLDGFSARSGIRITFEVAPDFTRLQQDAEFALFRVLQESLTNVHRHSGSQTAHVRLFVKKGMGILEIKDQGKGLPSGVLEHSDRDWRGALGVGLRGMNERMRQLGGSLEVVSMEAGTTVSAMVPVAQSSSAMSKSA